MTRTPQLPLTARFGRRWRRAGLALGLFASAACGCESMTGAPSQARAEAPPTVVRASFETPASEPAAQTSPSAPDGAGIATTVSVWDRLNLFKVPEAPPPPVETVIIRPDGIISEKAPKPNSPEAQLAGAKELLRLGHYEKAEAVFKYLADKKQTPVLVAEEAKYYQAESLRLQRYLPKAADTYNDLMLKFPSTAWREQATQHMFDIANYWLDDKRTEMEETREIAEGKRWFTTPRFIHLEREKPKFDEEGRAIEKLEQVRYNDINGPLADRALFLAGSVKFFNEDYREADNYFSQLHEKHPNSPLASQAVELAIVSKHLSTGGAEYDGRKVAEARKLVQSAFDNYPELATKKKDFLMRQLVGITLQQAEKDYKMAEFWKRTGHPGSAYFYFEMVRRRYPNTKFAEMAAVEAEQLKVKAESDPKIVVARDKVQLGRPAPVDSAPATELAPPPRTLPPFTPH